jgi:hypothetical protein
MLRKPLRIGDLSKYKYILIIKRAEGGEGHRP